MNHQTKVNRRKFIVVVLIFAGISALLYTCSYYHNQKSRRTNWEHQLGTYRIDLTKTNLGNYISESKRYENLEIVFKSDSTFALNMDVPFIYGSKGTWSASGSSIDDWNTLHFKENGIDVQFSQCCDSNASFYLNSVSPKSGMEPVFIIYFKKIQ